MEAYSEFANVYDIFMEDTPYEEWYKFIKTCIKEQEVTVQSVCELGCGTGKMTMLFAKSGCDVIGIDYSPEMLMVAQDRAFEEEVSILYLMQDMSEFEINRRVDLICSCCDSINYLLEEDEVKSTFERVETYLTPNGLFIFDMNTPYKYKEVLGNQIFADQTDEAAYIWENFYDEEEEINEYEVSFFIKDEEGKYERTIENHYQRAYSKEYICSLLEEVGLEVIQMYDNYSKQSVSHKTQRITYVARKRNERIENHE
ncbi:MAG: class I SAM-dependent methyltransferase [Candidatus Cellulosilyticum pullistercoris]|uniref:Class I SAM-dependent methyltransferase n=1 Tax=Candidatus Cellulosilyticum pullistercoris TaxID=2838521 RepID=A0A9E2KDF6_9FIRM|nr:class I SAM-dependent methyltransferase [Candidatus Cellulosilyticum pullistercoris]